jgi:hypothetical protein
VTKLSDAYRKLADAFLETADAIDEAVADDLPDIPEGQPLPNEDTYRERLSAAASGQPPKLQALPAQQKPQVYAPPAQAPAVTSAPDGSPVDIATTCPIHNLAYRNGNFGKYCPARADDPAWSDRKGYCSLPGRNAANALAWVQMQQAVRND